MSARTSDDDKVILIDQRKNIESRLLQLVNEVFHGTQVNYESEILDLLDAFYDTFCENKADAFINAFDNLLRHEVSINQDLITWQAVLSEMRRLVQPYLTTEQMIVQSENLWQQVSQR